MGEVYLNKTLTFALLLALCGGLALADEAEQPAFGSLVGQVTGSTTPLSYSKVYVYHLSEQSLSKVLTDPDGNFRFDQLPAGLYKVIAFKDGFVPAIALLTRSTRGANQYLNLDLAEENSQPGENATGFWTVREKIPSDVLRDIEVEEATRQILAKSGITSSVIDPYQFQTSMQAIAGVEQNVELGSASMTGGRVGVQGAIADFNVGLTGNFITLQPVPGAGVTSEPSGRSQMLSLNLNNSGATGVSVSTMNNYMSRAETDNRPGNFVGLERHQVSWSQDLGSIGRSDFSAEYAEENNFFRQAPIEPYGIPNASRLWQIEGSYSANPTKRSTMRTGFQYRERQAIFEVETRSVRENLDYVPAQRVDVFGLGGLQVNPDILVEFGLYSTMRDGSLSLSPSGGMALRIGKDWRALASGSLRVHDDQAATLHSDFNAALFGEHDSCQTIEEYCYHLKLAHQANDLENLSVGLVHRRYAETLHLYFNQDFFSRLESLYLVQGDNLPEVQLAASRRLSPKILARLSSNLATGGGGILYAMDETSYENQVRYLVTSLDTQFEHTSTGVFVAFHHVAQQLNPIEDGSIDLQPAGPEMELERLQVMLTQDLDVLSRLASDWAVHLNMELSRGTAPETDPQLEDEELRKRVMGGVTFSF